MDKLRQWAAQFDALSLRERLLILTTVVVTIALPPMMYLIEPAQKQQTKLKTALAKLEAENAQGILELTTLRAQQQEDPNQAVQQQITQLRGELEGVNQRLRSRSARLVEPQVMLDLLERVLAEQQKLNLVSLSKGAPVSVGVPGNAEAAEGTNSAGLYRHDLTLVVEGGFFDTLTYLQALEQLPQGFFWDELDYQVDAHPRARVTLRVHTLSTAAGWLGV